MLARREPGETGQTAAAEVQTVELHLFGRVGRGGRHDDRAQRRRLARLRTADHRHVARGPREVDDERVASLVVGPVDDTDGNREMPRHRRVGPVPLAEKMFHGGRVRLSILSAPSQYPTPFSLATHSKFL